MFADVLKDAKSKFYLKGKK